MKAFIRKHVPKPVWSCMSKAKCLALDSVNCTFGLRNEMIPPRRLIFIGSGDFVTVGDEFLDYFRHLCGLQPEHRVLDLGCGIGRMAVPLTGFLSAQGSYEGIDIVPQGIDWCTSHITSKYPRFRFQLADVFNKKYNPTGRFLAAQYRFPFADDSFDFIFLTSVFTHMVPDDVTNYLREFRRLLRPGGKCLITWLILNTESESLIARGKSTLNVVHSFGDCRVMNPDIPEEAIAYPETKVAELYHRSHLVLEPPIRYGSWPGRTAFLSVSDICIAHKALKEPKPEIRIRN